MEAKILPWFECYQGVLHQEKITPGIPLVKKVRIQLQETGNIKQLGSPKRLWWRPSEAIRWRSQRSPFASSIPQTLRKLSVSIRVEGPWVRFSTRNAALLVHWLWRQKNVAVKLKTGCFVTSDYCQRGSLVAGGSVLVCSAKPHADAPILVNKKP